MYVLNIPECTSTSGYPISAAALRTHCLNVPAVDADSERPSVSSGTVGIELSRYKQLQGRKLQHVKSRGNKIHCFRTFWLTSGIWWVLLLLSDFKFNSWKKFAFYKGGVEEWIQFHFFEGNFWMHITQFLWYNYWPGKYQLNYSNPWLHFTSEIQCWPENGSLLCPISFKKQTPPHKCKVSNPMYSLVTVPLWTFWSG